MFSYTYNKKINEKKLADEIAVEFPLFNQNYNYNTFDIEILFEIQLTPSEESTLDQIIADHVYQEFYGENTTFVGLDDESVLAYVISYNNMKNIITDYTFDASAKRITLDAFNAIQLNRVFLITNATANTIIYNQFSPDKGGSVIGVGSPPTYNVLQLIYDTALMNDTDVLQIIYDVPDVTILIDTVGADLYIGRAYPDVTSGQAKWQIQKVADDSVLWADGDNHFDNIWDNRTSLSYS